MVAATPEGQLFVEAALLRPIPRRVRLTSPVRFVCGLAWNVVIGLAVCAFLFIMPPASANDTFTGFSFLSCAAFLGFSLGYYEFKRARRARLLRSGIAVTGAVALAPMDTSDGPTIRYHYRTSDGKERTHTIFVPLPVATRFAPGQRLTILYNPARPDESCPYAAITDAEVV